MMKNLWIILSFFSLASCDADSAASERYQSLFSKPRSDRVKYFVRYDTIDQYEIMQIGNSEIEPPMIELIDKFADNGGAVVPILKSKLHTERSGIRIRNIAEVALELQRKRHYQSADDQELMTALRQAALRDTGVWSETTLRVIGEIEEK